MSKFKAILDAAKPPAASQGHRPPNPQHEAAAQPDPATPSLPRLGRPPGKRTDPDFHQITAYIRKHTHQQVKLALLQDNHGQEFSELVEELLSKWLQARSSNT